jgi:hypothetical protein
MMLSTYYTESNPYEEKDMLKEIRDYVCSSIPHELNSPEHYNGSQWNEKIPFNDLKECCDRIFIDNNEIISVGSGNGKPEKYLKNNGYPNIICIEPKIFSHNVEKIIHIKPDYNTVDEIILEKQLLIGNCSLMIIWPSGEYTEDCGYDIDAIKKLKPNRILVLYENTGYSGSNELRKFLDNPGKEWNCIELINVYHFKKDFPLNYIVKILQKV